MVELVEYIVKGLADNLEEVKVSQEDTTIKVELSKEDMGKVIGKQGKIVKAIRTIVRAAGMKEGVKYTVEIVDKQ
ncbi:MAG TPA: KH domain-containing protein [Clostridia bacterium]